MLIFDVGANRGLFADKCLENYPDAKIILVEPNKDLCSFLNSKYEKNSNVIIIDKIASNGKHKEEDFYISDSDTISTTNIDWVKNSRFSKSSNWSEPIKIKTITLDELVINFGIPDLIKIDVEGSESNVVNGLSTKVNELCFEWAEETFDDTLKVIKKLENLGYSEFGFIFGDEYLKKPNEYSKWGDCHLVNLINKNNLTQWGTIWVK